MKHFSHRLIWYRDLIDVLVRKEIQVRYKNNILGWLWSVGHPLIFGGIYWVIFDQVMRVPIENYPVFLLCGLFPWQWLMSSVGNAPALFFSNSAIIKKTSFPRVIIPLSQVLTEGIHFVFTLPVLVVFLMATGAGSEPSFSRCLLGVVLFLLQFILLAGLSCLIATLTLFLRDIERFVQLGLMVLLYATPVLYAPAMIPERWKWLLYANPVAPLIMAWRDLFMDGIISSNGLMALTGFSFSIFFVGVAVLHQLAPRFAEVL